VALGIVIVGSACDLEAHGLKPEVRSRRGRFLTVTSASSAAPRGLPRPPSRSPYHSFLEPVAGRHAPNSMQRVGTAVCFPFATLRREVAGDVEDQFLQQWRRRQLRQSLSESVRFFQGMYICRFVINKNDRSGPFSV